MKHLEPALRDLVIANRILAREDVVDAYGHVSIRHPDDPKRYFLACSRSPELVERADIMTFNLDGTAVGGDKRIPYLERFIHGAIYEARADIMAVVHSHAEDVLPFSLAKAPLRAVLHSSGVLGHRIPVWDIADRFGETTLLVVNMAQGRDLAQCLGADRVVLMRGHGFATTGRTLSEVVRVSVNMPRNARALYKAMQLGEAKPLSKGEIDLRLGMNPDAPEMWRAWEYWAKRAGCGHLLAPGPSAPVRRRGVKKPRGPRR